MFTLTAEQVVSFATDDASAKAARELANARVWSGTAMNESAVWGQCKGSGANPYQICVDIVEIAFKCSCPSRKSPCKHGLGLLFLLARHPEQFSSQEPPPPVLSWLQVRARKAQEKIVKAQTPPKPVDVEAQAKRAAKREQKVEAGLADLDRWLQDIVRQGLAELQSRPYQYWQMQAARLVDAQAPGMARMVEELARTIAAGGNWQEQALERLAKLNLLLEAFGRQDQLPDDLSAEVKSLIGFTVSKEQVLSEPAVADRWFVVGRTVEVEDKLKTQRTWLLGEQSRRAALVLSFAFGSAHIDNSLVTGTAVEAELAFFPGLSGLRALVKSTSGQARPFVRFPGAGSISDMYRDWSRALAKNPWTELYPVALARVRPVISATAADQPLSLELHDFEGFKVPLSASRETAWGLVAMSRGGFLDLFGQWNGRRLYPLGVSDGSSFVHCAQ